MPPSSCHMPCHAMPCHAACRVVVRVGAADHALGSPPSRLPARRKAQSDDTTGLPRLEIWPFMHTPNPSRGEAPSSCTCISLNNTCSWPRVSSPRKRTSICKRKGFCISTHENGDFRQYWEIMFSFFFSVCFLPCPSRVICKHSKWPPCNCQQQHDRYAGFRASRWHPPVREDPQVPPHAHTAGDWGHKEDEILCTGITIRLSLSTYIVVALTPPNPSPRATS